MTPVGFQMPANACDCHTHIHGDPREFPMAPNRVYTAGPALPQQMAELHRALQIRRVVIVTPSIYGTDNRATLWGVKARGADARAVVVIDESAREADLDAMHAAGARGIRLNLHTGGGNDPANARARLERAVERLQARGWHVQIYTNLAVIAAIKDIVAASPVPVVFDHFGGALAALGMDQPGFSDVLQLLRSGKAYVKISGGYRASKLRPDYSDAAPLARALIAANPERVVWGTDWPHPNSAPAPGYGPLDVRPFFDIDDGRLLNQLALWAPDPQVRKLVLVDNPARLYDFPA